MVIKATSGINLLEHTWALSYLDEYVCLDGGWKLRWFYSIYQWQGEPLRMKWRCALMRPFVMRLVEATWVWHSRSEWEWVN